jgi:ribosomal protein L20
MLHKKKRKTWLKGVKPFYSQRLSEHFAAFVGVNKSILYAVQRVERVHLALVWMKAMPPAFARDG